jgi:hypothetical protein
MTDRKVQYGLIETFCPAPDNADCTDFKCTRAIKFMDKCFIDAKTGELWCKDCGTVQKYERKMAERRKSMGIPDIKINGE